MTDYVNDVDDLTETSSAVIECDVCGDECTGANECGFCASTLCGDCAAEYDDYCANCIGDEDLEDEDEL